ncbi:MAG: CRTAC1 family protein [Planctomycetota bacterium]
MDSITAASAWRSPDLAADANASRRTLRTSGRLSFASVASRAASVWDRTLTFGALLLWGSALAAQPAPIPSPAPEAPAPWHFEDVAERAGLTQAQRSGGPEQRYIVDVKAIGAALFDLDHDGLLDVFLTSGSTVERHRTGEPGFGCHLYRNLGGLRFEPVALEVPAFGWASGVAAADIDGDGWDDLLITGYGQIRLLRNREGRLEDVTARSGIDGTGWSTSAAFADLDGDDDLDVYIARYLQFDFASPPRHGLPGWSCLYRGVAIPCGPRGFPATPDGVYFNRGDGTFEPAGEKWGLGSPAPQFGLGVLIADLVGDHRPDIFVANDASPNFLFENHGDRFEEIAFVAGVAYNENGEEQACMGVDAADLDGNGHLDLVVTNFEQESNNVFLNDGHGAFFDRPEHVGFGSVSREALSWGVGLRDFDGDGVVDVFVANGHVYREADGDSKSPGYAQRDHLFVGRREGEAVRFDERGSELGIRAKTVSRAAAFGDLDNDGDVDILVAHLNAPPSLYENHSPPQFRRVAITLEQPGANRQALGARLVISVGDWRGLYEVRRQSSFQSSSDPRIHVGLGTRTIAGTIGVRWPNGAEETFALPTGVADLRLVRGMGTRVEREAGADSLSPPVESRPKGGAGSRN